MKILIVNTVPTEKNGITNVIFNIFSSLDNEKINFGYVSITPIPEEYSNLLKKYNIPFFVIQRCLKSLPTYILKLRRIVKDYDAIHVHGNSATMTIELLAALLGNVKLRIAHSHNTTCSMRWIDKLIRPAFYKLCNGRIACGKEAGSWLFGKREYFLLKNGINVFKFQYNPKKRYEILSKIGGNSNYIIGNIGNFVNQKNHIFTIRIFEEIVRYHSNVKLLLVGDGPLLGFIKKQVEALNLMDKVIFTGSIENPYDFMMAMDIIIMPSLHEGLPLTLIEEQASGLECVVSDKISKDANLTNKVHFLSLKMSPNAWANKVISILQKSNTDRLKISEDSIRKIQIGGYDIKQSSQSLANYYLNFSTKL